MIPVNQTIYGDGENGASVGNCWQACVASLLEMPLEEVPHFVLLSDWYESTCYFVRKFTNLSFGCFKPNFPHTESGGYVIGTGLSPRGNFLHAVILDGVTGEIVHDPHHTHVGLAGPVNEIFGFIVIDN